MPHPTWEVAMGKVVFDISMSLDGFMTAANRRPEEPLGDGGERLRHRRDRARPGAGAGRGRRQDVTVMGG
jgi:hypothetical protein